MCFSFQSSVFTYLIGLASGIAAFRLKQYVLGCLILVVVQIQLAEAFIWYSLKTKNLGLNSFGTVFAKNVLSAHNLALGVGILLALYLFGKTVCPGDYVPLALGVAVVVWVYFSATTTDEVERYTFPDKCTGNLKWTFPHSWYIFTYILSLIVILIWVKPLLSRLLFIGVFTALLFATLKIFPNTVGSLWCWLAAISFPAVVGLNWLIVRDLGVDDVLV